jgi:hypothetical protein
MPDRPFLSLQACVFLAACLVLLPLAAFGQVGAPGGQSPATSPPTGTGRITVLVVAADGAAPVKRARVGLWGVVMPSAGQPSPGAWATLAQGNDASRVQREAQTDDQGRVEFIGLPGGVFAAQVLSSEGWVRPINSVSRRLADGESISIAIPLQRAGAVAGRIVDESGDPVVGVTVRAIRKNASPGFRKLSMAGTTPTSDDRGEFRIFDVPAGVYYVAASGGVRSAITEDAGAPAEPKVGFVPSYFPGVESLERAEPVSVRAGQDTAGIQVTMLRGRVARVVGKVIGPDNEPVRGRVFVSMTRRSREQGETLPSAPVRPDGSFTLPDVPKGDYDVWAFVMNGGAASGSVGRVGALARVTVDGGDVSLVLRPNAGAVLSGRVLMDGAPPPRGARVQVTARPASLDTTVATPGFTSPGHSPGTPEYSAQDGTFRITGARGPVLLTASSSIGAVKSIRRGAAELIGTPLDLSGTERIDDLEVVITSETGSIIGTVTDAAGNLAPGAFVAALQEDSTRWYLPFLSVGRAAAESDLRAVPVPSGPTAPTSSSTSAGTRAVALLPGQFRLGRLLPGRYYLVAVGEDDYGLLAGVDREYLEALKPKALAVDVAPGATTRVRLKIR